MTVALGPAFCVLKHGGLGVQHQACENDEIASLLSKKSSCELLQLHT